MMKARKHLNAIKINQSNDCRCHCTGNDGNRSNDNKRMKRNSSRRGRQIDKQAIEEQLGDLAPPNKTLKRVAMQHPPSLEWYNEDFEGLF